VEGKPKDPVAKEVMDNLRGRRQPEPKLKVELEGANTTDTRFTTKLKPYPEGPQQVVLKISTYEEWSQEEHDSLVVQIEIDPETKRISIRR